MTSAGDPWDKSGAVFAFAGEAGRDYLKRMQDGGDADTTRFAGIVADEQRTPALELMRFITPFGVGHFSHTERAEAYRPEAVAAWADVRTGGGPLGPSTGLARSIRCGLGHIDTWTAEGYALSAELVMNESPLPCDFAPQHDVTALFNAQNSHMTSVHSPSSPTQHCA